MNASEIKCVSPQRTHAHNSIGAGSERNAEVCKRACVGHTQSMDASVCEFMFGRVETSERPCAAIGGVTLLKLDWDAADARPDQLSAAVVCVQLKCFA